MPRVALVTDWFAPRRGGIESQLEEIARRLAQAGTAVGVITATPGFEQDEPYDVRRLDVATLPSPPLALSPGLIGALRAELRGGWDVVHAHVSVVSPVGWAAAWVARSLGLPCVVTFHSVLRGKAIALRALSTLAPISGARVAWNAVSGFVGAQARWALRGAAVGVLPNGVDLDWWSTAAGPRPPAPELTFVTAMRLHRKKRGRALVRVFARAMEGVEHPAKLLMVGDGPERNAIDRDVELLGLRSGPHRVEMLGWRSAEELRALYASAHAFVMTSVNESFGIAALEAAAAGLPVIARRSGVEEFVRDGVNGSLADSDEALAGAMRAFIRDPSAARRMRANPSVLSRFDWRAVVPAHLAEYDRATRLASSPAQAVAASA